MAKNITKENLIRLLPFSLLALLVVIFFYKIVFLNQDFFFRDIFNHSFPAKVLWKKAILGGEFPLWTPYVQLGIPYLADISNQALYFFNLLFLILPSKLALHSFIILHYFLCSFFTYLLCYHLTKNKLISIISSISFTLCGYCISISCNPEYLSSIAWLPAIFWAYYKGLSTNKTKYFFLTAIFLSMLIYSGDPFCLYFTAGFLLLRTFFEIKNIKIFKKQLAITAIILFLSLCFSAILVIPAYELTKLSIRSKDLVFPEATFWSFHPLRLIEFIFPNYFGYHFNFPRFWSFEVISGSITMISWAEKVYIGLIPLIFAFFTFLNNRNKEKYFWLAVILISLFISFGDHTPIYDLLYSNIPAFSKFRYPEKLLLFASFGLCILSSLGLKDFIETKKLSPFINKTLAILLLLILVVTLLFNYSTFFDPNIFLYFKFIVKDYLDYSFRYQVIYAITVILFLVATIYIYKIKIPNTKRFLIFLLIISFIDICFINQKAYVTTNIDFYQKPLYASKILETWDKPYPPRISNKHIPYMDVIRKYILSLSNKEDCLDNFYAYLSKYFYDNLKSNKNLIYGIGSIDTISPLTLDIVNEARTKYDNEDYIKFIKIFGIDYIFEKADFTHIYTDKKFASILSQQNQYYETLLKVNNPTQRILFSKALPADFEELEKISNYKITKYSFNKVELEVMAPGNGYITLLDSNYPGWKAYLNNKEVPIFTSNKLYRAVRVNKGKNKISFIYDPISVKVGAIITILSFLLTLILCIRFKEVKIND